MIKGRDGISLARRAAFKVVEVARQVSIVAALFAVAAIVALSANRSFAGSKKVVVAPNDKTIEDTVVVSNNGAILGGSIQTFSPGSRRKAKPTLNIKGKATGLQGTNAGGDAVSSLDGHIVVTLPLGNAVETFSNGATGNSGPDGVVAGALTGVDTPEGAAFENPFAETIIPVGVSQQISSSDIYAISNFLPVIVAPGAGTGICAAPPLGAGFSLGTITEYFSGDFGNVPPIGSPGTDAVGFVAPSTLFPAPATIAGCDTLLLGPLGLAFDNDNNLWVVNEAGLYVTEYAAGASGNASPIDIVGLGDGSFVDPQFIAVGQFPDGLGGFVPAIFVTDAGDNSVKIFDVTTPGIDTQVLIGTISGPHTKLRRPQGIASNSTFLCTDDESELSVPCDDLYVVNNAGNTLLMFDDLDSSGFGDVRPAVIIQGFRSTLNQPVGVALQQFQQVLF